MELRIPLYVAIAVAIVLVAVFAGRGKANDTREHNYRALFIIGLTWIPIGPPVFLQRGLYWMLSPIARVLGYQSYYERYSPQAQSMGRN